MLAIVMCLAAAADFAYTALQSSNCFVNTADSLGEDPQPRAAVDSDECRAVINRRDFTFRIDAAIALLGLFVLAGATVERSNAHRGTKRLVLTIEVAVVVLAIVYTVLLSLAFR
jgi:hypothetical protein